MKQSHEEEVSSSYEEELLYGSDDRALQQAAQRACGLSSWEMLKTRLDVIPCNVLGVTLLEQGGWTR